LNRKWVPQDRRDEIVDYVRKWSERTQITQRRILGWIGLWSSTFSKWSRQYGRAFQHNGRTPRDHWLADWERQAILQFHCEHPLDGYRRLTYMMIDANVVACSPSSVYRVLRDAGVLRTANAKASLKGTGFQQPLAPHQHWHLDIAYLNIRGTFYFIANVIDGYSRMVVHWEIREKMEETDIEVILQRARELYPAAAPRIITDNGPQFIAKDFKCFIRICGMTHVRTSPYYPQSNGKVERYHRTLKDDCIRPQSPLSLDDARRIVARFVQEYNEVRLHSAIAYVTPRDMLERRQEAILEQRNAKLAAARERRAAERAMSANASPASPCAASYAQSSRPEDKALLGSTLSAESMPMTETAVGSL
jgi:putative transposase